MSIEVKLSEINIQMSEEAKKQLLLILEHDHTIKDLCFRLKIDGKGCGGFDYALGFTAPEKDDLKLNFNLGETPIEILIDPFTAFYSKEGLIDFECDYSNDTEGFCFVNQNEKNYRGKFFKNETMVPPESSSN